MPILEKAKAHFRSMTFCDSSISLLHAKYSIEKSKKMTKEYFFFKSKKFEYETEMN